MLILTLVLVLISFFQVSFLTFDLVLLILITRSFILPKNTSNYYLAFCLGLLISILSSSRLGLESLVLLFAVKLVSIFRTSAFASHFLSLFPITSIILLINLAVNQYLLQESIRLNDLIWSLLLIFPVYFLISFWEESSFR